MLIFYVLSHTYELVEDGLLYDIKIAYYSTDTDNSHSKRPMNPPEMTQRCLIIVQMLKITIIPYYFFLV